MIDGSGNLGGSGVSVTGDSRHCLLPDVSVQQAKVMVELTFIF